VVLDVVQVTTGPGGNFVPALLQATGDKLLAVFQGNDGLWSRACVC